MKILEEIRSKEFRRNVLILRREKRSAQLKSKLATASMQSSRSLFEPGYLGWMPCPRPAPDSEKCVTTPFVPDKSFSARGTSSFLVAERQPLLNGDSHFEPQSPRHRPGALSTRGAIISESKKISFFSKNPYVEETSDISEKNNWGIFESMEALIRKEGSRLMCTKSPILLTRELKRIGVSLDDVTLEKLFKELDKQRQRWEYQLRLIYGNMFSGNEKRFPMSEVCSWTEEAPGGSYVAEKDQKTIEGRLAKGNKTMSPCFISRTKRTSISNTGALPIALSSDRKQRHVKQRRNLRQLRRTVFDSKGQRFVRCDDDMAKCRTSTEAPSVTCNERPWSYMLSEELRGRDVSELRVRLSQIASEATNRAREDSKSVRMGDDKDAISELLESHGRAEWKRLRSRRCGSKETHTYGP